MYSFCFFFFSRKNPIFSIIRELYKKNLGFHLFFLSFFWLLVFCGCLPVRRTRNRLCATNSHLAQEVSFSPTVVSTPQGGFFRILPQTEEKKRTRATNDNPTQEKTEKKKERTTFPQRQTL